MSLPVRLFTPDLIEGVESGKVRQILDAGLFPYTLGPTTLNCKTRDMEHWWAKDIIVHSLWQETFGGLGWRDGWYMGERTVEDVRELLWNTYPELNADSVLTVVSFYLPKDEEQAP